MRHVALAFVFLAACGGGDTHVDGDVHDGPGFCRLDSDCSDRTFCNGLERCAPGPGADARGCRAATAPCLAGQTCDEAMDACITDCATTHDADSDGHAASVCGGDDCDDADPARYPGNTETCDADDHDEDCDALTFGSRDVDVDGHIDAACCNTDGSATHCGDDCADSVPAIHPTATEACNGIDDDCNGMVDEGVTQTYHADTDLDGFGASTGETRVACAMPAGFVGSSTDCDDGDAQVHPGATRVCNGVDDECAGAADVGCPSGVSSPMAVTDRLTAIGLTPPGDTDDVCPDGQVLVGLHVETGSLTDTYDEADYAYGICGTVSLAVDMRAPPYVYSLRVVPGAHLPGRGSRPGTTAGVDLLCPTDAVAIGVHGISTNASGTTVLRNLALDCSVIDIHGSPGAFIISYGATTTTSNSGGISTPVTTMIDEDCPTGRVLKGIATASATWLTSFQALCGALDLDLVPAP